MQSWLDALDQPIPAEAIAALQAGSAIHRGILMQLEA